MTFSKMMQYQENDEFISLQTPTHRKLNKDTFKFSYFPRTIKEWNELPEHIVTSSSPEIFKSKLVDHF